MAIGSLVLGMSSIGWAENPVPDQDLWNQPMGVNFVEALPPHQPGSSGPPSRRKNPSQPVQPVKNTSAVPTPSTDKTAAPLGEEVIIPQEAPAVSPALEATPSLGIASTPDTGVVIPGDGSKGIETSSSTITAEDGSNLISLNFQNTDINLVINFFSDVTGLTFILGDNVRGPVTVISNKKIPVDEALDMLQSILEIKGYAMVRYDKVIKIVTQTEATQKSIEIRTGSTNLADGDRVITQIIPLRYILASEVKNDLQPLISRSGNMMTDDRTNALILTDVASNIRKIMKVLEQLDVQVYGGKIKVEIISLHNAEETALAAKIKNILMGSKPRLVNYLEIVPDARLHALIVITNQSNIDVVRELVSRLDKESTKSGDNTKVFFLQNSKVEDMAKILGEMLKPGANSLIDGNINMVTDNRTNALIITTATQNFARIKRLLDQLDVRTPQVLIKALLVEVTLNKENRFGLEWSYIQGWGEHNPNITGTLTQGFGLSSFVGDGIKYSVVNSAKTLSALIQMLATDQKTNILSTPQVLASNNQQATIRVGEEIPVLKDVSFVKTDASVSGEIVKSYDYKTVAIELVVTPRINMEKDVALDVLLTIKNILGTNVDLNAPILASREAKTSVVVKDGQTIVIGGLMKDDNSVSDSKIPLLGDIPLVGWLFKKQGNTKEKTELMVFITPYVVTNYQEAEDITKTEESKIKIKNTPYRTAAKESFLLGLSNYKKDQYQEAIDNWQEVIDIGTDEVLTKKSQKYIKKAQNQLDKQRNNPSPEK